MSELDELQAVLDRSWELARQANDRPRFRAALEKSVYNLRDLPPEVRDGMIRAHQDPLFQEWVAAQAARLNGP
jgi:hypothetical protein